MHVIIFKSKESQFKPKLSCEPQKYSSALHYSFTLK